MALKLNHVSKRGHWWHTKPTPLPVWHRPSLCLPGGEWVSEGIAWTRIFWLVTGVSSISWMIPGADTIYFVAVNTHLCEWSCPSIRLFAALPSVCPPVASISLCSSHRVIMKFSSVITIDTSDDHAKGEGHRSKVKVTEVNTNFPIWEFPNRNSSFNSQMATKWCTMLKVP